MNRNEWRAAVAAGLTLAAASALSGGVPTHTAAAEGDSSNIVSAERCEAAATWQVLELAGGDIVSVEARHNTTGSTLLTAPVGTAVDTNPFCEVQVSLTHGPEGGFGPDDVSVWLWFPEEWNGRLQAIGGGGTRATNGPTAMAPALKDGYAVVASDSGVPAERQPNIFLTAAGEFDWQLFENWTYRGVHDSTVVAQQAVEAYYGDPPSYSYWNGCSNGGRQGLAMTQRYPDLFDGVLAAAPAMYGADRLNMTMSWPAVVQNERLGGFLPPCKLRAMSDAVIASCDDDDGLEDGLVSRPELCDYRAALREVVGTKLPCGKVKKQDAAIAAEIFRGPHTKDGQFVWYGHTPGMDLSGGVVSVPPSFAFQNFAFVDLGHDWRTVSTNDLVTTVRARLQGRLELLATADPALDRFHEGGGKLLMWHGLADGLFPADQSIHYRNEVAQLSGDETDDFFRLFLAPGVDHCGGGSGPKPVDPFAALVEWVENGHAPAALAARSVAEDGSVRERNLCAYPQVQVYQDGDPNRAGSFSCGAAD